MSKLIYLQHASPKSCSTCSEYSVDKKSGTIVLPEDVYCPLTPEMNGARSTHRVCDDWWSEYFNHQPSAAVYYLTLET